MKRKELIKKYIDFFKSKNHKEIINSSLLPENDPTVLFTTAGMHPIVSFLSGQSHPQGKRLCNVQRCIRTQDIEEVGDSIHHTFFEMLGNWSLGDYWKKEAIEMSFEFLTKILKIPKEKLAVSCFKGDKTAEKDSESAEIWKSLGIPKERIIYLSKKENWWGPTGKTGPCGPDTEVFYWSKKEKPPKKIDYKNKNWIEIGNNVIMQYYKNENGKYTSAKQKNIDFGGGVERTVTVLSNLDDNYLSDSFLPIIKEIEKESKEKYGKDKEKTKSMRIIADHIKAAVMILGDNVTPSNVEQGYVLRRLIRRSIRYGKKINIENFTEKVSKPIFKIYDDYPNLKKNKEKIINELKMEEERFQKTLEKGIKIFNKIAKDKKRISGKNAFLLFQSYGFPLEMTKELSDEKNISVNEKEFKKEFETHQKKSRTASKGKFQSGLLDNTVETTKLHTATHLLHDALRKVLGKHVEQKGSNITPERLRFDFSHSQKLTDEEKKKVEELVNSKIKRKLSVTKKEMSPEEAKKSSALGFFEHKYGDVVTVYTIGDPNKPISKEICTGPHVKNTRELGRFKIKKEESSSLGVRRIKAVLE